MKLADYICTLVMWNKKQKSESTHIITAWTDIPGVTLNEIRSFIFYYKNRAIVSGWLSLSADDAFCIDFQHTQIKINPEKTILHALREVEKHQTSTWIKNKVFERLA